MTGLHKNVVKAIDRARLSGLYTEGEGSERTLRKPERQARYLGADKFKLHNGRRCTTVIIDLKDRACPVACPFQEEAGRA